MDELGHHPLHINEMVNGVSGKWGSNAHEGIFRSSVLFFFFLFFAGLA
jgi:hypothetical protein